MRTTWSSLILCVSCSALLSKDASYEELQRKQVEAARERMNQDYNRLQAAREHTEEAKHREAERRQERRRVLSGDPKKAVHEPVAIVAGAPPHENTLLTPKCTAADAFSDARKMGMEKGRAQENGHCPSISITEQVSASRAAEDTELKCCSSIHNKNSGSESRL